MLQTLKTMGILRLARAEATDPPGARSRSLILWALIALLLITPSTLWVAARRRGARGRIAAAKAATPERTTRANRPADREGRAPVARAVVASPEPKAPTPAPAPSPSEACEAEGPDAMPAVEASARPETGPEVAPGPGEGWVRPSLGEDLSLGRALFDRHWRPDDPRCHGGDGLGPVYNATSCLDCHGQGGPGGGGPLKTNAVLVTVVGKAARRKVPAGALLGRHVGDVGEPYLVTGFAGNALTDEAKSHLVNVHPGFAETRSIVLHRFGVEPGYGAWRQHLSTFLVAHHMESFSGRHAAPHQFRAGLVHHMALHRTERNPTPLFGAGLIDATPALTLYLEALNQAPETRGKVSRTSDGGVGRFGWKGQTSTLKDFVLSACANELGLEVPGHHQGASPLSPGASAKALDLTAEECNALEGYVRSLPRPAAVEASGSVESAAVEAGGGVFVAIGCADCHTPNLGSTYGIYSDLLLHDMGEALGDPGTYYGGAASPGAATPTEWRTPPLWGVRDSGPYLHDGRAPTLDDAILRHGGQGQSSARRFAALGTRERSQLRAFLNSLAAPAPDEVIEDAPAEGEPARVDPQSADLARRAEGRLRLGQSLERMGKPEGAVNFYRDVVKEAPNSPQARLAAGRIAALTGSLRP